MVNPLATKPVEIVLPRATSVRVEETAWRGGCYAGCITRWPSARACLHDPIVHNKLVAYVRDTLEWDKSWDDGKFSVVITFDQVIGWASTISFKQARGLSVGPGKLNKRATALFVDDDTIPAPRTCDLTVVYSIGLGHKGYTNDGHVVAFVHSIYPGKDVGELTGDVSLREKVVFFPWTNPGDDVVTAFWKKGA